VRNRPFLFNSPKNLVLTTENGFSLSVSLGDRTAETIQAYDCVEGSVARQLLLFNSEQKQGFKSAKKVSACGSSFLLSLGPRITETS
jgi:hypothetical protein